MLVHTLLAIAAIGGGEAVGLPRKQQPLHDTATAISSVLEVQKELKKAEIIPTGSTLLDLTSLSHLHTVQ